MVLVDLHESSLVPDTVAVVGRGEDGCELVVVGNLVSFHDELMGSGDEFHVVAIIELFCDVLV